MGLVSDRPLRIGKREVLGSSVLEPHGLLDGSSYRDLRDAMAKAGVDEPRAVIVDADGLDVRDRSVLSVFPAVAEQLGQWPGVPLLVASGTDELRHWFDEHRLDSCVPVHWTVAAAAAAVGDPPSRSVLRLRLPNSLVSASLARVVVRETCEAWAVPEQLRAAAVMIVNELVENTLIHTYCAPSARLELRRGMLSVGVYDDAPMPGPTDLGAGRPRGSGLTIVSEFSDVWGSSPTPSGGKAVWAVLRMSERVTSRAATPY
jgi:anti-anti-sigma regulatory factor